MKIRLLDSDLEFPPVDDASPEGILAVGGDLSPSRLIAAYEHGAFPWYNPGEPILWWTPPTRAILPLENLRIHKSMRNELNKGRYKITFDTCFSEVVKNCANIQRPEDAHTWISNDIHSAYCNLHELGLAHSVEAWLDDELVGGLYGVSIGQMFFGESMFSKSTNASKVAFTHLVEKLKSWGFGPIDCQIINPHLESLGAIEISREDFSTLLAEKITSAPTVKGSWNSL